jgi:hemophore-related protein
MVATAAIAIVSLSVGAAIASAEPAPAQPPPAPNCTAADLAGVAAGVAAATSAYLFTHPDVNDFFTGLRGLPDDAVQGDLRNYMDANPQVHNGLRGIRQPLTDLRDRCQ